MKKQLIATLVGGLILFFWQFASWSALNVHGAEINYTPNQEKILEFLTENLEEGEYFMPTVPPGTSAEDREAATLAAVGKPWAQVLYHDELGTNMPLNMIRGLLINLVSVFLLIWILMKIPNLDFKTTLLATLAVGAIGYLTIPYLHHVWFENSTMGYLIDTIVQWGLVGAWLGWYLTKK